MSSSSPLSPSLISHLASVDVKQNVLTHTLTAEGEYTADYGSAAEDGYITVYDSAAEGGRTAVYIVQRKVGVQRSTVVQLRIIDLR